MAYIAVFRKDECLARGEGDKEASLLFAEEYRVVDEILFSGDGPYLRVKADACVETARLYAPSGAFRFAVPLAGDGPAAYPPFAFRGERHLLSLAPDRTNERRNLALNPLDQHGDAGAYPHAEANVETRGESVFFARNVIDGVTVTDGHGAWPYQSWGVGRRTDAALSVRFGREVTVDELALYLRADFPHDDCWREATAVFSDGSRETLPLRRYGGAQRFRFPARTTRWLRLERFASAAEPEAFSALKQLMVFGADVDRERGT